MSNSDCFEEYHPQIEKVINTIEKAIIGKRDVAILSLTALLAEGHVLLEDVPGVGKTLLVRSLAKSIGAVFNRIQFTPDMLPSDLTGLSIYNQRKQEFEFIKGPLMGNIILADEINRTSPKTQSALLEGMEEGGITVDGTTHELDRPFFVMATQNPIEYEGTFPLPEAQLDRFLMKLTMGYPSESEELEMLNRFQWRHPLDEVDVVLSLSDLLSMQEEVNRIHVSQAVKKYIVTLVKKTRSHRLIALGTSPRGTLALMKAAQSYAFIHHRDFVIPDDVKYLAPYVLSHRIVSAPEARIEGVTTKSIINEIVDRVDIPIRKEHSLQ